MSLPTLTHLEHAELVEAIKGMRNKERHTIAEIVLYLSEIDSRGIYRDYGYSSLFAYCTGALGYSGAGAQRRIVAARALKSHPEIYDKIRSGKLTLCAVAELASVLTTENKDTLLTSAEGMSRREVEKLTSGFKAPERRTKDWIIVKAAAPPVPDMFTQLPPAEVQRSFSFHFETDAEFMELYEKASALMAGGAVAEVFRRALKTYVRVKHPEERFKRREAARVRRAQSKSVPVSVRDAVFVRDGGRCRYIAPDGHRCTETHGLELDHIWPRALGGKEEEDNLRLMCPVHNQLMAERAFGREKIQGFHL